MELELEDCFQWFVSELCKRDELDIELIGNRSITGERGEKNSFGRMRIRGLYEILRLYKILAPYLAIAILSESLCSSPNAMTFPSAYV